MQTQVTRFTNSYSQWRLQSDAVTWLRDNQDNPPEQLLQAVWQHQRIQRDQLKTLDGRKVRVLHPGFISREGGPDFRGAVLQIGDDSPRSGDVEVDLRPGGWKAHGHDRNPAFASVILHVVWSGDNAPAGSPPLLTMNQVLDAPLGDLNLWLDRESGEAFPEELRGKCSAPLRDLTEERRLQLLHDAAGTRFQSKAAQLHARARHAGWEQALWEGLFRGLGYKHNAWPMHCLAETRERWSIRKETPFNLQARLLGLGGLLPPELARSEAGTDAYARRLWDSWWRERDEFGDCILPRTAWHFHGLRPANHPQRRLALAAHWIAAGNLVTKLERWCLDAIADETLLETLVEILQPELDEYWGWHWTIKSPALEKPQLLLGADRVTDLAVNVILPWLWTRAAEGKNAKLQAGVEHRYFAWPSAEDNAVLKLARQRLLGGVGLRSKALAGAAAQQGLIQIVRDFCDHSNAVCDQCRFPELVREFCG